MRAVFPCCRARILVHSVLIYFIACISHLHKNLAYYLVGEVIRLYIDDKGGLDM